MASLGEEVVVAGDPVACRSWLVRATGSPPPGPPYQAGGYAWPPGNRSQVNTSLFASVQVPGGGGPGENPAAPGHP